jgi:hypothetical protein
MTCRIPLSISASLACREHGATSGRILDCHALYSPLALVNVALLAGNINPRAADCADGDALFVRPLEHEAAGDCHLAWRQRHRRFATFENGRRCDILAFALARQTLSRGERSRVVNAARFA